MCAFVVGCRVCDFGHCCTVVTVKALSPLTFSLSCVAVVLV